MDTIKLNFLIIFVLIASCCICCCIYNKIVNQHTYVNDNVSPV